MSTPPRRPGRPVAVAAPTARRLHVGHFAFMRALVQGVSWQASWDRYLRADGEGADARTLRATVQWVRDELGATARRQGRHGLARLIGLDPSRVDDRGDAPSLADFARERGLEDFSESEQVEAYQAVFGSGGGRSRRARLIERQLEALRWLESRSVSAPAPQDPVDAWLSPALAVPLLAAGVQTLGQLANRLEARGPGWTRGVRGVGRSKGARIERWLSAHAAGWGEGQRTGAIPAICPLDRLVLPPALDGRATAQPDDDDVARCTDAEAIHLWLGDRDRRARERAARQGAAAVATTACSPHTHRAYLREAERFLLWCVVERGKPVSAATPDDCRAYGAFLADPQPAARWCRPRATARDNPRWRPFEGPLSPGAQRQAMVILRNMFAHWEAIGRVAGNPWAAGPLDRPAAAPRQLIQTDRSFSAGQWRCIDTHLAQQPGTAATARLRFALALLRGTGLRLSEAVAARLADVHALPSGGLVLQVRGRGHAQRQVALTAEASTALADYLASRGVDGHPGNPGGPRLPVPADGPGVALIGALPDAAPHTAALRERPPPLGQGIAASTLYRQLKRFFASCAAALAQAGDTDGAAHLARASTHWLRHTHASQALAAGAGLEATRRSLGHARRATVALYARR